MPAYRKEQGGAFILSDLRSQLATANSELRLIVLRDDLPVEYRRRMRQEATKKAEQLVEDARSAFYQWAADEETDARKRYAADPVGSAADEARRNTNELKLARLIETAKAADARTGPKAIGGRVIANPTAFDYADKAMGGYIEGRYDEALLYGQASIALGGPARAQQAADLAQGVIDAGMPERAQALRDFAKVETARRVFERDINAAVSEAYTASYDAAKAVGDDVREFRTAAAHASIAAKTAAWSQALASGEDYVEPAGALSGAPTGTHHVTDGELDRMTHRVD